MKPRISATMLEPGAGRRRRPPRGFTLIEAILALAISALILATISAVFVGGLHVRESTDRALDASLPIERAMNLIRRDLENAVPPGGLMAGPLQSGGLAGGSGQTDGIQVYTTTGRLTDDAPWGDIQKVVYQLETSADQDAPGKDLVRIVTRNLLPTGAEDDDTQFLASGVASLKFSYFDGAAWNDTWDASTTTNLPQAIRVTLQLAATNSQELPPLQMVVPLMAQGPTNTATDMGGQNGN